MTILGICSNVDILKAMRIVRIVIKVLKITVPIILILSCMTEVIRSVTSQDNDITSKMLASWARKAIAAVLIFLIPTFINILAYTSSFDTSEVAKCIRNSNSEGISQLQVDEALKAIEVARKSLTNSDYNAAYRKVFKIKDKSAREPLNEKLAVIGEYVDLRNQIIDFGNGKYNEEKYKELKGKVEAITDEEVKTKLLKELEEAGLGKPLDVTPGKFMKTYNGLQYYIVIPEGATTNMPLITYLEGGNPNYVFSSPSTRIDTALPTSVVLNGKAYKYMKFIYIMVNYKPDNSESFKNVKSLMAYIQDKYKCDPDKNIVTGVSNGAVASFWLGYTYPTFFSAVVPLCGPAYGYTVLSNDITSKAQSISKTNLWVLTAGRGDFGGYATKGKNLVNKIHSINPSAKALYSDYKDTFVSVIKSELGKDPSSVPDISKYEHCTISSYYRVPEFWEWMMKQ